jgi:hypothetical protein
MGKLTLLLVLAAVLSGSLLTFHARSLANETARERGEVEYDLLAREAAVSAQSVVVNAMLGANGFVPQLGFSEGDLANGRFTVDAYDAPVNADGQRHEVTFTVTGHSGGATHTINSRYAWDPLNFPGPLWLDVPYATAPLDPRVVMDGGQEALPSYFDPRLYEDLGLASIVPIGPMDAALTAALAATSGRGGDYLRTDLEAAGLLEDLNVHDAHELYYTADAAHDPLTDPTLPGPATVSSTLRWQGDKVALVTGDLTIASGGVIEGDGALVVEGALRVAVGGQLDWDGLVIVHSEEDYLPIELDGNVRIDGALVVSHLALPPGGHMDFTVTRDLDGSWAGPQGDLAGAPPPYNGSWPFFQHTHRYDIAFGDFFVPYIEDGDAGAREFRAQFYDVIRQLPAGEDVYLEFANTDFHGYARYALELEDGDDPGTEPDGYAGMVRDGFGDFAAVSPYRTEVFDAGDLLDFSVDVRSLRSLQPLFDGESNVDGYLCDAMWPSCVGSNWDRRGALTVRLKKGDGALLYEGALYWHMQRAEYQQHLEEEAEWRRRIESGEAFGTQLRMGPNVGVVFNVDPIEDIGPRLGFDIGALIHIGTWTSHVSTDEHTAAQGDQGGQGSNGGGTGGGTGGGSMGGGALITLCHRSGQGQTTLNLVESLVGLHLLHGDRLGACTGGSGSGGSGSGGSGSGGSGSGGSGGSG